MEKLRIAQDEYGNKVVLIPNIIFSNRQNIDWKEVEVYLRQYIGEMVGIIIRHALRFRSMIMK